MTRSAVAFSVGVICLVLLAATAVMAVTNSSEDRGQTSVSHPDFAPTPRTVGAPITANPKRTKRLNRLNRHFHVRTRDRVFFVTVDDGLVQSRAALAAIAKYRIPVTAFLTTDYLKSPNFFRRVTSFGGTVENHTMSHPALPRLSDRELRKQICVPQRTLANTFGRRPTMLRPPYGEGGYTSTDHPDRRRIDRIAAGCGLRNLVMWNAVADRGRFQFLSGSLRRGDIVLLHFTQSLPQELERLMTMARKAGLKPAPLQNYL